MGWVIVEHVNIDQDAVREFGKNVQYSFEFRKKSINFAVQDVCIRKQGMF